MSALCACGSCLVRRPMIDAQGIFCTYACDACWHTNKAEFDPAIFNLHNYPNEEPIDEN